MSVRTAVILLAVASLGGCAFGPQPQTPQEFRQAAKGGGFGKSHESYQVDGPYKEVATRIAKKSAECLNKTIRIQSCVNSSCQNQDYIFHPHFHGDRSGAELSLQVEMKPEPPIHFSGKPPKGGFFATVVDIKPVAGRHSSVAVYSIDMGMYQHIPPAIKHWADGSNLGCPDLTADM